MRTLILGAVVALALAGPADAQDAFEDLWAESGEAMEAEGINERTARLAWRWIDLQYGLGLCRGIDVSEDDVAYWRDWWDDTTLPNGPSGRFLIEMGTESYVKGLEARIIAPPDPAHCQTLLTTWTVDGQAIADSNRSAGE